MGVYKLSANSVKNGRTIYGSMLAGNTAYTIPTSFESIATVTVGSGGASSVEFTSIPATYSHLQIRAICQTSSGGQFVKMQFNNDTTLANYRAHIVYGHGGGTASSDYGNNHTLLIWANNTGSVANTFAGAVIDILDYANTNKYKTTRSLDGYDTNSAGTIALTSGLWMSTSTITSIKFLGYSGNPIQYSQFALYGIRSA
jgi:hypothetical protein